MTTKYIWTVGMTLALVLTSVSAQALGVKEALLAGLAEERMDRAYYSAVMLRFGPSDPFRDVSIAEDQHEAILLGLLDKYQIAVPPDPFKKRLGESNKAFISRLRVPKTHALAARKAYNTEVATAAFYWKMMKAPLPEDVLQSFGRLREDSRQRHVVIFKKHVREKSPTFERCHVAR